MILHVGHEIPAHESRELDCATPALTGEETRIIKDQIRKNAKLIDEYVRRLDLFVNQERYPQHVDFVTKLRARLAVLMDENDTFRKVLWEQYQRLSFLDPEKEG